MTDQSNPQVSATIQTLLSSVFGEMGTAAAQQNVQALNPMITANESLAIVQPYNVQTQGVVPGKSNYFDFLAPGIMAMVVMMSVMTGLPAAISQEKEIGTMDGMMVAPINRLSIILGKALSQTARGMIQGIIILILAILLFGVTIQGSIILVFGLLLLGVFSLCRTGNSDDLVREGPANGNDVDDYADVPHDVPEWSILPDTADALVHAGYIEGAPAHLCIECPKESHGSGRWDTRHNLGAGYPDRIRSSNDRYSRSRVQTTDDQVDQQIFWRNAPKSRACESFD